MNRFLLALLSSPALLGSALSFFTVIHPAHAIELAVPLPESGLTCGSPHQAKLKLTCQRVDAVTGRTDKEVVYLAQAQPNQANQPEMLEFTEEESDAAVALFGCDCPLCLNALRQLRNQPPLMRG